MKFYHVIDNRKRRSAGITIAAEVVQFEDDPGKHQVFCGLSYCAPVERQFSRPRGRIIAQSRLSADRELPPFKRFDFTTDDPDGLKIQILSLLRNRLSMDWAQSLVDKEIARLQEVQAIRELDRAKSDQEG